MNWIKEYYKKIESGEIITGKKIKKIYSQLISEMDNKDLPYYFNEEKGERPIEFIERFMKYCVILFL